MSGAYAFAMSLLTRIVTLLRPAPRTSEEIAADEESRQLREEMETARMSQRSYAGQNYQSGRSSTYK